MVNRIAAAGDLYQADYEGWYCVSCEAFKQEKDLIDGLCPIHRTKPDWIKERKGDKPWAIMIGHKAPHSFYVSEDKYKTAFANVHVPYPASAFMLDDKPEWYKQRLPTWHGIYGPLFDFRKTFPDTSPAGVTAFAQDAGTNTNDVAVARAIAAGLAIGIAAFGGALGQGRTASAALEGIARNPNASDKLFTPMILGLALIESLVIYALVVDFAILR